MAFTVIFILLVVVLLFFLLRERNRSYQNFMDSLEPPKEESAEDMSEKEYLEEITKTENIDITKPREADDSIPHIDITKPQEPIEVKRKEDSNKE